MVSLKWYTHIALAMSHSMELNQTRLFHLHLKFIKGLLQTHTKVVFHMQDEISNENLQGIKVCVVYTV